MNNRQLSAACFNQDLNAVMRFLHRGQDPNGEPFVQAVLKGDTLILRYLISYWARITPCDIYLCEMRHGTYSEQTEFLKSNSWLASLSGM